MKEKILFTAVIWELFSIILCSGAYAYDDGDFQVWHTENQEKKINEKSKITLEEEFRFGDNADDFYYHHYDIGVVYTLNKNLDLAFNYRQIYEKKSSEFKEENRPHIGATFKYGVSGFKFEDRNCLGYRHFDYQDDFWQYRNKFTVKFPWRFTRIEIQPYLADEIFVDLYGIELTRNRFYSGLGFNLTENLKAEIYYLLQSSKNADKWTDANVLGSKLKVIF